MNMAIDLSQQNTWPEDILAELDANFAILSAHEKDKIRDVDARIDPPKPLYSKDIELLLKWIDSRLSDQCLLGFHCTRLHQAEILAVKAKGLLTLSENTAFRRVRRLREMGEISEQVASKLLLKNAVNDRQGIRLGRLCFIFSRSCLTNESGVSRLFSQWGGEALYWGHENDPDIAPVLRSIGRPCIVQVSVPIARLHTYSNISEKLLSAFLIARQVETEDNDLLEGSLSQPLASNHIQRIIEFGEPDFAALTEYMTWRVPLLD